MYLALESLPLISPALQARLFPHKEKNIKTNDRLATAHCPTHKFNFIHLPSKVMMIMDTTHKKIWVN